MRFLMILVTGIVCASKPQSDAGIRAAESRKRFERMLAEDASGAAYAI